MGDFPRAPAAGAAAGAGAPAAAGFLVPAACLYALFCLGPLLCSFWWGLFPDGGGGPSLENYQRLLADRVFWLALGHNLLLVAVSLAGQLPLALFLAWLLAGGAGRVPGRGFFRAAFFCPVVLPTAAVAILWLLLFDPHHAYGLFGAAWRALGLAGPGPAWLDRPWALWSLILVVCWRHAGFHLVLFLAALENVPRELVEAAAVDGATPGQTFRHVLLPALRPVVGLSATLSIVGSLKYFDLFYIMTGGGPDHASELVTTYLYAELTQARAGGYASALAAALLAAVLGLSALGLRLAGRLRGGE